MSSPRLGPVAASPVSPATPELATTATAVAGGMLPPEDFLIPLAAFEQPRFAPGGTPQSFVRSVVELDPQFASFGGSGAGANSAGLVSLVDTLVTAKKQPPLEVWRSVIAPFPVAGPVWFRNDFGEFRIGPPVHPHQGIDVFAPAGSPVLASVAGTVSYSNAGLGGLGVHVASGDGTETYCAHLSAVPKGLAAGSRVEVGDVIGFVGETGNAEGGSPHCHFEVRINGRAINPFPLLTKWLAEAEARAKSLVELIPKKRALLGDQFLFGFGTGEPGSDAAPKNGGLGLAEDVASLALVNPDGVMPSEYDLAYETAEVVASLFTPESLRNAAHLPALDIGTME